MKKKKIFPILLVVIVAILSFSMCGKEAEKYKKFEWNSIELHKMLPKPKSNKGDIIDDTDSDLWIEIVNISQAQYSDYIDDCKKMGFDVECEKATDSYSAFNDDGFKLSLDYDGDNKELTIRLEAPIQTEEFQWPKSDIAKLLPEPKSSIGRIEWEASYGFVVYVGETSTNDFDEYVDACAEKGFTVDYRRGDSYYYADNADGYHISLRYEGNSTMFVRIDEPNDAEETPSTASTASEEIEDIPTDTPSEPPETSAPAAGIRPEFKEAMDSYEKFFDEYITFMKNFSKSNNPASMMIDYANYMSKYAEAMTAMDNINDGTLSNEELAYYIEVQSRISGKLLTVAQ